MFLTALRPCLKSGIFPPAARWLLIACVVSPTVTFAATKYVAKAGNDQNDGNTIATAYLTIGKGVQEIGSGGRLYIGGGTYDEAILNTIPSGTSNAQRTVVTNYKNEIVTLRPTSRPARVLEFAREVRYITFAANAPGQIILDGSNVSANVVKFSAAGAGGTGATPSYIRLENLEIKNGPDSGVLGFPQRSELIRLHVHHCGRSVYDHGLYIEGCDNVIEECDIHHNYARGIQIFMSGKHQDTSFASRNIVRNCRIHHNGLVAGTLKPGIDADSGTENQIYNNLIHNNGQFGILIQMGGARNLVYNNTVFGNGTTGILVKSSAGPGNVVRDNVSWGNGSGAQIVDEDGKATVSNNSSNEDPHFASTDVDSPDFLNLTRRSTAAIDKVPSPANADLTRDFWGVARPQGKAIDAGAAEYAPKKD